ncbi:hypothetical protein DM01DRAFT_1021688 [Hesseltinella vesiculosa]|uniref:Uncharacterized protein n=1 Tax=Hesseltinella vesiculosa TaxID=101127 RepID=A0A1X2GJV1_9FUNG|nr:hypothetical protein DM01DRAFT_1021688 [Hesseltinella vesiculosa]
MTIIKNGKVFKIQSTKSLQDSPHRPKMQKLDLQKFEGRVLIANGSGSSPDHIPGAKELTEEYRQCLADQKDNKSLHQMPGIFDFMCEVLTLDYDNFVPKLWQLKLASEDPQANEFKKVLQYALTDFHLTTHSPDLPNNHERTAFVELVIPAIKSLAKITNLTSMNWCEHDLNANKMIIDALGKSPGTTGMEHLIIESSSGGLEESVPHTLDDSIKLIECSTMALSQEASARKDCSWNLFKNVKVLCIQVICSQITLSVTQFLDRSKWKHLQLRSAQLPSKWQHKILIVKFAELLATLYLTLNDMNEHSMKLDGNQAGVIKASGQTVREVLG